MAYLIGYLNTLLYIMNKEEYYNYFLGIHHQDTHNDDIIDIQMTILPIKSLKELVSDTKCHKTEIKKDITSMN